MEITSAIRTLAIDAGYAGGKDVAEVADWRRGHPQRCYVARNIWRAYVAAKVTGNGETYRKAYRWGRL